MTRKGGMLDAVMHEMQGEPSHHQGMGQPVPQRGGQAPLTASEFNEIKRRIPALDTFPDAQALGNANEGFVALFHAILDTLMLVQGANLPGRIRPRYETKRMQQERVFDHDAAEDDGRC